MDARDDSFRIVASIESKDDACSASCISISRTRFTGKVDAETRFQQANAQAAARQLSSSEVRRQHHSSTFAIFDPRVRVKHVWIHR